MGGSGASTSAPGNAALTETPRGGPPLIAAQSLSYQAGGARLIDGVDLAFRAGRCTVVLGPNGAGKSVLLRLLHGLLRPSAGAVLWQGGPLDGAALDRQAMVFQRPVLLRRSVRANLRFVLRARGLTGAARTARERTALEEAGLTHLAGRPARVLSGGEQQRLALARALATDPELLLMDEPTASLDPASTHAIEAQVRSAMARGVTPVLVTHDAGQARRLGDDGVFLHRGRVAEAGPALQLLDTPASEPARAWRDGRLLLDP